MEVMTPLIRSKQIFKEIKDESNEFDDGLEFNTVENLSQTRILKVKKLKKCNSVFSSGLGN